MFSNKPGNTTSAEHRIETGSAKPVRPHPYHLPHAYRETVQKEFHEMEAEGIIEPSKSEWASPITNRCVGTRHWNGIKPVHI